MIGSATLGGRDEVVVTLSGVVVAAAAVEELLLVVGGPSVGLVVAIPGLSAVVGEGVGKSAA